MKLKLVKASLLYQKQITQMLVDKNSGKRTYQLAPQAVELVNNLMYAKEKAKYIIDHGFPVIEQFYSDSLSDLPMMALAERGYLVKNGTVVRQVDPASPGGRVPKK